MPPFVQSRTCPVVTHQVTCADDWPSSASKIASSFTFSDSRKLDDDSELVCIALGCCRMLMNHRTLEARMPLLGPDSSQPFILYLLGQLMGEMLADSDCRTLYNVPYARAAYPCAFGDGIGKYIPQQHGLADFVAVVPLAVRDLNTVPPSGIEVRDSFLGINSLPDSEHSEPGHAVSREGLNWVAGQGMTTPHRVQLPIFFLSSKAETFDMMASMLSHREACGIAGPVMGLTLESSGTLLQAVIGWSEEIIEGNAICRQTHVAYGIRNSTDAGVFDLADSTAVRSFATFLRDHVREVYQTVGNRQIVPDPNSQRWRLDHGDMDVNATTDDAFRQRILDWRRELDATCPLHPLPLPTIPASASRTASSSRSCNSENRLSSFDVSMTSSSSSNVFRRAKLASTDPTSEKTELVNSLTHDEAKNWPLIGITPTSGKASDAASSAYIKKFNPDGKIIMIHRRVCNLIDRRVCTVAWPPASRQQLTQTPEGPLPESFSFLGPYLRELLGTYSMEREIPTKKIEGRQITLFENRDVREDKLAYSVYETFPTTLSTDWHAFQDTIAIEQALRDFAGFEAIGELGNDEKAFLIKYFPQILDISRRAHTESEAMANEAEFRQYWDALGALLHYPSEVGDEDMSYRLEQRIPIARNCYFDQLSKVPNPSRPTQDDSGVNVVAASFDSFLTRTHQSELDAAIACKTNIPLLDREPSPSLLRLVPDMADFPQSLYLNLFNSVFQRKKPTLKEWDNNWLTRDDIAARVLDDPNYGITDACGLLRLPDGFPRTTLPSELQRIKKFQVTLMSESQSSGHSTATTHEFTGPKDSGSPPTTAPSSPKVLSAKNKTGINPKSSSTQRRLQLMFRSSHILGTQAPFQYSIKSLPAREGLSTVVSVKESMAKPSPFPALLLAFIFWEYKRGGGLFEQGMAQARQDLISGVRHLAAVGIEDMPLFAIVTDGLRGICLAGWGKRDSKAPDDPIGVFIADTNCPAFDLRDPAQAVRYACFLIRLRFTYAPELRARFDTVRDNFRKRWNENDPSMNWTMEHQKEEPHFKAAQREYEKQLEGVQQTRKEAEALSSIHEKTTDNKHDK